MEKLPPSMRGESNMMTVVVLSKGASDFTPLQIWKTPKGQFLLSGTFVWCSICHVLGAVMQNLVTILA